MRAAQPGLVALPRDRTTPYNQDHEDALDQEAATESETDPGRNRSFGGGARPAGQPLAGSNPGGVTGASRGPASAGAAGGGRSQRLRLHPIGCIGGARILEPGSVVHFNGSGPDSLANVPPFRVLVGEALRLSGSLRGISPTTVRLGVSWQAGEVTLPRPGVQAVVQRTGEARILVDGFETLDATRWSISGKPVLVDEPHLSERRSLRLPAGGASLVHRLDEPLAAGGSTWLSSTLGTVIARSAVVHRADVPGADRRVGLAGRAGVVGRKPGRGVAERSRPGSPTAGSHARLAPLRPPVRCRSDRDLCRRQGAGARQGSGGPADRHSSGKLDRRRCPVLESRKDCHPWPRWAISTTFN